ncbi:MAG: class D sortase [Candidatus Saccharimonadales bacterium]
MAINQSAPNPRPQDLNQAPDAQAAANLIRQKVAEIYGEEPDAAQEIAESKAVTHRSKHQDFMYRLSTSGKDLATVQTEWHNYYQSLPPTEQHQVWQEFYSSQSMVTNQANIAQASKPHPQNVAKHKAQAGKTPHAKKIATQPKARKLRDARSSADVQEAIKHKVSAGGKLKAKHHLQSLLFGLGMGAIVLIIFLFGFFNEVIVAPFIQPSRTAASTPLIVSNDSIAAKTTPEVIIPKINVQIPVVYGQTSIKEDDIQNGLENGVVHYPTTSVPGQNGNAAFFGHSSNNIFNKGKYKFAFVLLHLLEKGDTFYLTYEGKVYAYKVFDKKIVQPSQVDVLDPVPGKTATATLITCDPPGTSLRRLVVVGEQISPDPVNNKAADSSDASNSLSQAETDATGSSILPGNGPTLLARYLRTPLGKLIAVVLLVGVLLAVIRWINKPRRQ